MFCRMAMVRVFSMLCSYLPVYLYLYLVLCCAVSYSVGYVRQLITLHFSVGSTINLMILLYLNLFLTFEERNFYQGQKSWIQSQQKINNFTIQDSPLWRGASTKDLDKFS